MTNTDDTILREVDTALAEDKQASAFKKNLPLIVGVAAALIAGVGGFQYWEGAKRAQAEKNSAIFDEIALTQGELGEEAIASLQKLAAGKGGYSVLAKMRLAAEHVGKDERDKALALYREIYASGAAKRLKDFARLRAGYLSLADGRDAVIGDVGPLETDESELGHYAREIIALAALRAGDYQGAEGMFLKAASTLEAPEPIKLRAKEFAALAASGKAGVVFPTYAADTKSDGEKLLEQLNEAGADLSAVLDAPPPAPVGEDGHDHSQDGAAPNENH